MKLQGIGSESGDRLRAPSEVDVGVVDENLRNLYGVRPSVADGDLDGARSQCRSLDR